MNQHKLSSQKMQTVSKRICFLLCLLSMMLLLICLSACKKEKSSTNNESSENRITDVTTSYNNGNDEQEGDENSTAANSNQIKINSVGNGYYEENYGGNVRITFQMNGKAYSGITNPKGEIIYYSEDEYINFTSIGKGTFFVTTDTDDDEEIYTVFSENGQKIIESGDAFDKIIGYGDGFILVYKNTSTITTVEHSYGVLDCNGNWVKPLAAGTELPVYELWQSTWSYYKHIGNGVFMAYDKAFYGYDYVIFNSNTNKSYSIESCYIYSDRLCNGVIYGKATGSYCEIYERSVDHDYDDYSYLPSYFAIHTDGTFEAVSEFTYAYNNLLINTDGQYMRISDKTSNTEKEYTAFPSEMISHVQFEGEVGIVILNGADEKTYFTIIDKDCNQKTEPIVCADPQISMISTTYCVSISEGRIVYQNGNNIYEVIDTNGNTVVSDDQGFTYISEYSGGIAYAENGAGECYILGLDGNPLTIKLK